MPENRDEVSEIMTYWQKKGAWVAKRRPNNWAGSNDHVKLEPRSFRIACSKSSGLCTITWDGKITNCDSDFDGTVIWGDVNVESIQDIWRRRNEQMVKYHFSHEWDKLPAVCQRCNDWQLIGSEPRFDEHGNPIKKNYNARGQIFQHDNNIT